MNNNNGPHCDSQNNKRRFALERKHPECTEELNGANQGNFALICNSMNNNIRMVKFLLKNNPGKFPIVMRL